MILYELPGWLLLHHKIHTIQKKTNHRNICCHHNHPHVPKAWNWEWLALYLVPAFTVDFDQSHQMKKMVRDYCKSTRSWIHIILVLRPRHKFDPLAHPLNTCGRHQIHPFHTFCFCENVNHDERLLQAPALAQVTAVVHWFLLITCALSTSSALPIVLQCKKSATDIFHKWW